jgi:SAM-dependent methyltransferase
MRNLLPRKIKDFLKAEIVKFTTPLMAYSVTFLPFQRNNNAYIIHKITHEHRSGLAIPPKWLWASHRKTIEEYLTSGKEHGYAMLSMLIEAGNSFEAGSRILDFGCAAGRITRWLENVSQQCEIWGTDISAEHIEWCKQHLSPPFHFLTTTTLPHLPFDDGYFNLIYAGSVFTHTDDLADAWFLELRRVLRPGGKLYITIHDRNTISILNNERDFWLSRYLYSHKAYQDFI